MDFFGTEISRIVLGCNRGTHFNALLRTLTQDYYTQERWVGVMHQCNRFGINAYNATGVGNAALRTFQAEGGKFHFIAQGGIRDLEEQVKAITRAL